MPHSLGSILSAGFGIPACARTTRLIPSILFPWNDAVLLIQVAFTRYVTDDLPSEGKVFLLLMRWPATPIRNGCGA